MVIACCLPCRKTSAHTGPSLAASNRCIFRIIAFVHRTDLRDSCVQREEGCIDVRPKILYSAQRVSHELGQGGKGPKATLVELISR